MNCSHKLYVLPIDLKNMLISHYFSYKLVISRESKYICIETKADESKQIEHSHYVYIYTITIYTITRSLKTHWFA
jgi:hypothetical protein